MTTSAVRVVAEDWHRLHRRSAPHIRSVDWMHGLFTDTLHRQQFSCSRPSVDHRLTNGGADPLLTIGSPVECRAPTLDIRQPRSAPHNSALEQRILDYEH